MITTSSILLFIPQITFLFKVSYKSQKKLGLYLMLCYNIGKKTKGTHYEYERNSTNDTKPT